jgi:hemoglobin-like flavoprotein
MFDLQPDATSFFPFSEGYSLDDDEMYESALFEKHIIAVVSSINAAIELLEKDDMKTLVSVLKDLGVRHAAFDLEMFHYDLVGEALLFALRETVGHSFDGRMKNAWAGVFGIITDTMMQGTKEFVE